MCEFLICEIKHEFSIYFNKLVILINLSIKLFTESCVKFIVYSSFNSGKSYKLICKSSFDKLLLVNNSLISFKRSFISFIKNVFYIHLKFLLQFSYIFNLFLVSFIINYFHFFNSKTMQTLRYVF